MKYFTILQINTVYSDVIRFVGMLYFHPVEFIHTNINSAVKMASPDSWNQPGKQKRKNKHNQDNANFTPDIQFNKRIYI